MGIARTSSSQATDGQNILALRNATQVPQHAVVHHYDKPGVDSDGTLLDAHVWVLDDGITVLALGDDIAFVHQRLGTH